jgi:dihydroneopterin aldolase
MSSVLIDPRLADCRRLFVRDYEVRMNIGAYESEKRGAQRVRFNVELFIPLAISTPKRDALDEIVNSDIILAAIKTSIGEGHIHLQETVCDNIASVLLSDARVRAVRVITEKVEVYADCESVGVEVFRFKEA